MSKQQHQKAPETAPLFTLAEAPISKDPRTPKRGTRAWMCLYDLLALGTLNQCDYHGYRACWRLSAAVKELDYLGWKVHSVMDYHQKREYKIAFYTLDENLRDLAVEKMELGAL